MITFLTVIHVVVSLFLIVVVLLQHGKGADMGSAFGGAGQAVFGARGAATILHKITAGAAVLFMVTSLSLAYLSAHESSRSVFSDKKTVTEPKSEATTAPVTSPIESKPAQEIPEPKTEKKPEKNP